MEQDQRIINYIKQSREAGAEDSAIRQALLGSGFSVQDIEEAIISLGAERSVLENMQNRTPMFPRTISGEQFAKPRSMLGKALKIFLIIVAVLAVFIGGYFVVVNHFPQYSKYVKPYVGPVLDPVVGRLVSVLKNTPFVGEYFENATLPEDTITPTPTMILPPINIPIPSGSPQTQTTDSDSDGLSNSDEIKYKTDPNKPDTDSDGYPDGEEVQNGYNPLGPGRATNPAN